MDALGEPVACRDLLTLAGDGVTFPPPREDGALQVERVRAGRGLPNLGETPAAFAGAPLGGDVVLRAIAELEADVARKEAELARHES